MEKAIQKVPKCLQVYISLANTTTTTKIHIYKHMLKYN